MKYRIFDGCFVARAANIKMYYNGQKLARDYNPPEGYDYQWTGD
jgi:hypothetical protein